MHLGEGTGAVALFPLLDMACDIYEQMETFQDIKVEQYQDYGAAAEEN
jgi:nicotinate-nucleotide--dimethylbenzimidazole phosphoribosyltransferase